MLLDNFNSLFNIKTNTIPTTENNTNKTNNEKTSNSLNARELTPNEKNDLVKITDVWKSFADNKAAQNSPEQAVFQDSSKLCGYISSALNSSNANYRFFICSQSPKDIESIAVVTERTLPAAPTPPHLYVEFLMTHPKNIRSTLNDSEPNRVNGAASKMISHIAEVAQKANIDEIRLYSLTTARGFYQKIGFTDAGASNMILSLKKTIAAAN